MAIAAIRFRHLVTCAVLVMLLVRAAVPGGWMYAAGPEDGRVQIQLCSGRMVSWSPVSGPSFSDDENGDPSQDEAPASPDDSPAGTVPCPYAMASVMGVAVPLAGAPEPVIYTSDDHATPPAQAPPRRLAGLAPLPARGPPLSV